MQRSREPNPRRADCRPRGTGARQVLHGDRQGDGRVGRATHSRSLVAETALSEMAAKREEARSDADELASLRREVAELDERITLQRKRVIEATARAARVKEIGARLREQEGDSARKPGGKRARGKRRSPRKTRSPRGVRRSNSFICDERLPEGAFEAAQGELALRAARWLTARSGRHPPPKLRARIISERDGACASTKRLGGRMRRASVVATRAKKHQTGARSRQLAESRIDEPQIIDSARWRPSRNPARLFRQPPPRSASGRPAV